MTKTARFSKWAAIDALRDKVHRIAVREKFDLNNGTSQLHPKDRMSDEQVRRAVEYGRMRAFEDFANDIEGGFVARAADAGGKEG